MYIIEYFYDIDVKGMSRQLLEKLILLVTGSIITYYLGLKMLHHINTSDIIHNDTKYEVIIEPMVINKDNLDISFDDIKGHTKTKELINNVVLNSSSLKQLSCKLLQPPNGIILHGPPGTGKTMFARAIAKSSNSTFINFSSNVIENKMYGESSKILNALFTFAHRNSPSIIFIDELDGFFSERSSYDQTHVNALKTLMLSKMDGFLKDNTDILFIGATNNIQNVDKAIKRRMRTHIFVDLPNCDDRKQMFIKNLEGCVSKCISYDTICTKTEGLSGSDIYELCKHAAHKAYDENSEKVEVKEKHILSSLQVISL